MTLSDAKKVQITEYLDTCGVKVSKLKTNEAWYLSPIHNEDHASFKVDLNKNIWYDHGIGFGGTIIDLVMKMESVDIHAAIRLLSSSSFSFSPAPTSSSSVAPSAEFEILSVKPLANPILCDYLCSRKINLKIAKIFLEEIYFKKEDSAKSLFALAFKNDKGGYETRNSIFKGNLGGKAITTIRGKETGNVAVFEGFMDFLSVLTKYNTDQVSDDVIVLNSLSLLPATYPAIQKYDIKKFFLDRDSAGISARDEAMAVLGGLDGSIIYRNHKDANDWLQNIT